MPKFYVNIGPGVLAAFLGAEYKLLPDTTWFSPPVNQDGLSWESIPLQEINLSFNQEHPLWRRVCDLTRAAVTRWGQKLVYGITDIGGNLDVLASLIGAQRLAMELIDNPAEVERLCAQIRQAWLDCYDHMHTILDVAGMGSSAWACVWAPGRMYMFQSDFAYMISPALFRRLVIPDLEACCQAIPYSFYHLDGKGQIRHLDQLLALEQLRGIQWVPGDGAPPAEEWMDLLKRIRQGGKLCQVYTTVDGARRIIDALGGRGFVFDISDDLTVEQAASVVEELSHG
jgi:5-methyltetrahydrofolate--homocysteine methyltransferase